MNTKVRLSIVLSILWVLSVIAYVAFNFISVPETSCTYYIPELLGDTPMPAFELDVETYKSFFLSCGNYTQIMYRSFSNYSINNFVLSYDLQLIEINIIRIIWVAMLPPILIVFLILLTKMCIIWVKNGKKYDR